MIRRLTANGVMTLPLTAPEPGQRMKETGKGWLEALGGTPPGMYALADFTSEYYVVF